VDAQTDIAQAVESQVRHAREMLLKIQKGHLRVESLDSRSLTRFEMLTILRGQLTLIRRRAEENIPVSAESIARAESIAQNLEAFV
jgi:hypothetical protein